MKDPDRGFCPGNVFWGSAQQRLAHRRHLRNVTVGSETLNLTQWADRLGLHRITLAERLSRHDEAVAVTAPKLARGGSRIRKTTRRKGPRVHIGVYDREAAVVPDPEVEVVLRLLQQCGGEAARIRDAIQEAYGDEAAERAFAVLANMEATQQKRAARRSGSRQELPFTTLAAQSQYFCKEEM
jgi:hypothetical protein